MDLFYIQNIQIQSYSSKQVSITLQQIVFMLVTFSRTQALTLFFVIGLNFDNTYILW